MSKNVLKSKFEKEWEGYDVVELPIKDIWASVPIAETLLGRPFFENLKKDITKDGLHFPIMAVHTNYVKLERAKERWGKKIRELPFWHNEINKHKKLIWSVWGGSNRLEAANQLGYTHIDCAVLPNIAKAISLQKIMRKPFNDRYYK